MACPGGKLMADQGVRDMCEQGYEGGAWRILIGMLPRFRAV